MNDDLVVQKISKLLENNTSFIGYALNGGVGTKINVRNTETGKTIQALSINVDSSGEVLVVKDSADNQFKAVTFKTAEKVSSRIIQTRRTRFIEEIPKVIKPEKENIKLLFYVNCEISQFETPGIFERLWKELWIGGTWPVKKIYTVPSGYRLADAFIVNTGEKEEDYVVMGRLFPVQRIHLWYESPTTPSILTGFASILFTIEKGVITEQGFGTNSCHPYFWRYCGGGFFYSSGSHSGVNTVMGSNVNQSWPIVYSFYSPQPRSSSPPLDNPDSFINFAFKKVGITTAYSASISANYYITPSNIYIPLLTNLIDYGGSQQWGEMLLGVDVSSKWYYKTKTIETKNINTFYLNYTTIPSSLALQPGRMGFMGELCVTPTKDFAINYEISTRSVDSNGSSVSPSTLVATGFVYEPLIVNNSGTKTLVIKQAPTTAYDYFQTNNSLVILSDSGESSTFTQITGIPELNNFNALGLLLSSNALPPFYGLLHGLQINGLRIYPYVPEFMGSYSSIFDTMYYNYGSLMWNETVTCALQIYYKTTSNDYYSSLSANQAESNKEILYLKEFLLNFARFTKLTVMPSDDVRPYRQNLLRCQYLKPLSSYIENSIYIPYGFIDTNNTFYGTQSFKYAEPEKTRLLPQTSKATVKVVELKLNETQGQVEVAPTVKALPIYMVTPEKTGSPTTALASANYWCKEKTKGKRMPIFTPTPSEVFTPPPLPFVN